MAELALLHDTSADEDGFFICGDTAQTITRGVGFRFTDVKLLFGGRPKLAQLKTNFRTHAGVRRIPPSPPPPHRHRGSALIPEPAMTEPSPPGILGAANALVGLVTRLFPNSLDRLEEGGRPPTFSQACP